MKKRKFIRIAHCLFLLYPMFFSGCYCCYHPYGIRETPEAALTDEVDCNLKHDAFTKGEFPEKQWWLFFDDDQLNCFIETALEKHPRIKIAEANVFLANYAAKMTRAALLPSVNSHGEIYRFRQSKTGVYGVLPGGAFPLSYTQTTVYLDFEYELDWWNKNRNNFLAKVDLIESSIAELGQAQLALSLAVAQAYFDFQINSFRKSLIKNRLENRQKALELTKLSVTKNIRSPYSTLDIEREMYFLRDLEDQLNEQIEIDVHSIQELTASDFCEGINENFVNLETLGTFPLPCDLPLNLLSHRPEIISQRWKIESNRHEVYSAEAEFYPNINLSGILGFQTIELGKLFQLPSAYGYWGPAINLPIYDAGKREANLGIWQERYESAVLEYENLLLQAVREVLDAITQLRESYNRVQEYLGILRISHDLYQLAETRFKHHVDSYFNILNAEKDLLATQDDTAQIFGYYLQAQLKLFKALGGGFSCEQRCAS